jgi:hypothetical protein
LTENFPESNLILSDDLFLQNSKILKKRVKICQTLMSTFTGQNSAQATNLKNLFNHDIYNEVTR